MPSQIRLALIPPSHRRLTPLLSVEIHRPNAEAAYTLELETRRAVIGEHEKPDIRISVTETAWRQILSGRLSPWKALATRRLLVNGNLSLPKKLLKR